MPTLEELQQELLDVKEKLQAVEATNIDLTNKNAELSKQNENLIEHNNKLFTRLTAQQDDEPKEPQKSEDEQFEAEVIKYLNKEEK